MKMYPLYQEPINKDNSDLNNPLDEVEDYFNCITSCSLDDSECLNNCVDELKELN